MSLIEVRQIEVRKVGFLWWEASVHTLRADPPEPIDGFRGFTRRQAVRNAIAFLEQRYRGDYP